MAEERRACGSCGTANEEDARFCEGCGESLGRVCATCGVEASATARFCRACGAPLEDQVRAAADSQTAPARKTVTMIFADLAGSTSFEEQVDVETARDVIGSYHDLLRSTAERNRAGVVKYIGDGFMAVWGVPEMGPDDAGHAVDAAVELQERFVDLAARVSEAHGVDLALRVAVNTGEVVVGAGDADLVGDALNVAARLEGECPRGHVVVGEETWRSTRGRHRYDSLGEVQVKGRTAPVAVYQWLARQSEAADSAVFVGRDDEVRRLQAALEDTVAARSARLVTVIGDPGVGKSRLAAEFVEAQRGVRVIQARCDVEQTVALAPIVEVLRARDLQADFPVGVPERDRVLSDLNGLAAGVPGSVEETFWALRRFVEVLASGEPLVIVLDDLHWGDTLLLDFVEHLAEWVKEVPVLVLALARPELREIRPDLVTVSRWVSDVVHVGGLDPGATAQLAAGVLGASRLPEELVSRLPSSTGGNPLFVRELVGMLVHDGVLVPGPVDWRLTIDVDAITIPPTIHALLASRLERLNANDRRVLEVASVVGVDFSLAAVCALEERGAAGIKTSLDRLGRLELAQPTGAYVGDEPVWRFHHVLIRDVAYRRLLKSDRADLHERLAGWVEAGGASLAFDTDEMVARHLDSAQRYRLDLGMHDENTDDLALRSARCYLASARRALDRDQLVSAGTQAARGAALAATDETLQAALLLVCCEAFLSAGDVAAGAPFVDDLDRIAGEVLAPWATCYRCQFVVYTDPERLLEVDARLQGAIDEFARRGDAAGLAKAYRVRANARARLGRIGDCEADLFEALVAARQGGDHRQITAALSAAPNAALWGPSPVAKAGGRCLDVVRMQRMTTAAPSLEATSLRCLAVLELLRGRPDKARSMLADARQVVAELGLRHGLLETELFAGYIELMVGEPIAAEPHFRNALEGLDALGVGVDAGQAAALLARSVLAQGRVDEADLYATESERLAGHNLKTAIAWRAVRAEILAAQNQHDEAVAMAREAVAVAAGTDLVLDHADACLALGRVLAAAGDARGASDAGRDAEALYALKEATGSIGRTVDHAVTAATGPMESRLAVANRASAVMEPAWLAIGAGDVDGVMAVYSDSCVYDDRRRLRFNPIEDRRGMRATLERIREQYDRIEWGTLAVRGERLQLMWSRWSDDAGNETTFLHLFALGDNGRICYDCRFDEDDFEGAYRELERRYYAGEGAAFAEAGAVWINFMTAYNHGDFDRMFNELSAPEMRLENRSPHSVFPDRSAAEFRASAEELNSMVASVRAWDSALCWLSPTCAVTRQQREAVGLDGERYAWTRIFAYEIREGRLRWLCLFDPDDEGQAFAVAEERMRATRSRLAVSNRASQAVDGVLDALRARNAPAVVECYADRFTYDDRRRLSGEPIDDRAALLAAIERILAQYKQFEVRTLAVRGERLQLSWSRWSDEAGNETTHLHVTEVGDDGRTTHDGRFDGDDFEGAYRELERRYYAGEGAAFAEAGAVAIDFVTAFNQGDFDRVFGELTAPEMRMENRSHTVFPDRSIAEFRASVEELNSMVASARIWHSATCWLSPTCGVIRQQREAVGLDGEHYAWTMIYAYEFRDGRLRWLCQFDPDDEEQAFAVAEERARATPGRLAVSNRASQALDGISDAMRARNATAAVEFYTDGFTYDDRRRLSGDAIDDRAALRAAVERILAQYTQFEARSLAVRGERLQLSRCRWSDEAGNETTHLRVIEVGDDGRITYAGRYEEDDFEDAYQELERRYYGGEGAAFAEAGAVGTHYVIAFNQGEFDRVFGELSDPEMRLENRSHAVFPDRSIAEFRASAEELNSMIASARIWHSAMCWLSPTYAVTRRQREAVGLDGERYTWTQICAYEIRDGRLRWACQFDADDEEQAFAVAEERMRASRSRLAVSNRASQALNGVYDSMRARNASAAARFYADRFTHEDRRQLSGDPIDDRATLLTAAERILAQYRQFEARTLAVRGEHLHLSGSRWSDDAGNETTYLHVIEVGDDGLIRYDGRFDGDDFEGAYRELERRYYAGEGAAYAESGATVADSIVAVNNRDFDRLFGELSVPELRVESRTLSAFPDRSASELRDSFGDLNAMVASTRTWLSAVCWVSPVWSVTRIDRDAVGPEGEQYAWSRILVIEIRDGRLALLCEFEVDDEDAAFAFAEQWVRATACDNG